MREIILNGFEAPTLAPSFELARAKAIKGAEKLGLVTSLPMEELTVEALAEIQRLRKGIVQTHKDVKLEPLRLCQELDALKNAALEPLAEPEARLKKGLGDYAEAKRQEALAAERQRQAEIAKAQEAQRIEQEKAAAAAKAQADAEAEAERLLKAAAMAKTTAERERAQREADKARCEAVKASEQLQQASATAQAAEDSIRTSVPVVATKAKGAATKYKFNYRVINMGLLYKIHPEAVEMTERKSVLNILINAKAMSNPDAMPTIEGLEIWREADVTARGK